MADALLDQLAADLPPVRPRSAVREFGLLILVAAIETALLTVSGLGRADLGELMPAMFWWKLAAPALLALAASATALRALDPARRTVGSASLAVVAVVALLPGLLLARGVVIGPLAPMGGLACVFAAAVFATPPALALGLLLARGAPAHPRRVALAAAVAGGAWGATLLGLHCPNDGALHALLWHSLAIALPALAAAVPLAHAARW